MPLKKPDIQLNYLFPRFVVILIPFLSLSIPLAFSFFYPLTPWLLVILIFIFYFISVIFTRPFQRKLDYELNKYNSPFYKLLDEYQSRIIKLLSTRKVIETGMEIVSRLFETTLINVLVWQDKNGAFSPLNQENSPEELQFRVFDEIILWMSEQDQIFLKSDFDETDRYLSIREDALDFFERTHSELFVPFNLNKNLLAILYTGPKKNGKPFSPEEVEFLNEIRHITSITLSNTILYERMTALNENLEEKVKERTEELEETQGQLIHNEKMASLGVMVAGIAHEINTPAGVINGSIVNIVKNLQNFIFNSLSLNDPNSKREESAKEQNTFLTELTHIIFENREKNTMSSSERYLATKKLSRKLEEEKNFSKESAEDRSKFIIENNLLPFSNKIISLNEPYFEIFRQIIRLRQNLDNAAYGIKAISSIVKALKYYSHLDQSHIEYTDIHEGLENTIIILHNQIKKGIEVVRNYDELPKIEANPGELNQIWTNLINNSIHAMNEKGTLEIDTSRVFLNTIPALGSVYPNETTQKWITEKDNSVAEYFQIKITDSGKGIPKDIQEKIFDPFFTTKAPGEGSGLGLGIVKKIIEKHKGFISFFSESGKTSISVYLPYHDNPEHS